MGNYRPFLQGPLPVANYTRIIIPGRFWTRPPSTKSTRMASSATPLHDSLIELAIPDAHAHAIKWYLNTARLPGIYGNVNRPCPRASPSDSGRFTAINPQHPCYNYNLEYSCNKYCDLIGHSEVSISHRDLQVFIETYKFS